MLAGRRLTEAQLWTRLARRGYADGEIGEAVASCRAAGFLDDALFAQLFVDGRTKAVGDSRLIADLVRRGISREAAQQTVAAASSVQNERLDCAIEKLLRSRPSLSYPSAARALERLGFPAPSIYRALRRRLAREPQLGEAASEDSI